MDQPANNTNLPYQDDEITLKELIEKIIGLWKELWSKKWWIILIALPFMAYFGYNAKTSDTTYKADLTYTLNDGSGGGGALAGILGTFGLGKGGKVNLDKIVELSKSRNIMHKVFFTTVPLDTFGGKKDFIANHIINLHKLDHKWTDRENNFLGFNFKNDSISAFDHKSLAALKNLYGKVVGSKGNKEPLFTNSFNEDTGILTMSSNMVNEELSIIFVNLVYKTLKEYYIASSTKGNQTTFEFVEFKTDSIFSLLKIKEFQLAKFNDSHRNLADPGLLTQKKLIETEILKLKTMYAEATKNRELADFSLTAGTPDITIIDEPISPLDAKGESFLIALIKGALIGGAIASGFFIARKIVMDAMANA
jgi:hypothetical protein